MSAAQSNLAGIGDEARLAEALLAHDGEAWREFVHSFEPLLRYQAAHLLGRAAHRVLDFDEINDVVGDLYLRLLEDDMRRLRMWLAGAQRGRLAAWLGRSVTRLAIDHLRHGFLCQTAKLMADIDAHDDDHSRGGAWLEMDRGER